jgi:hypothetical protein
MIDLMHTVIDEILNSYRAKLNDDKIFITPRRNVCEYNWMTGR